MNFLIKLTASLFGAGYFPIASGTFASALAAVILWFLPTQSPWFVIGLLLLLPISAYICGEGEKIWSKKDDRHIVIDEAIGQAITYTFIPHDWRLFIFGFFLFRLYDIVKIPPAGRAEKIQGGWGVLLDDVICGIYANLGVWIVIWLVKK